MGKELPIYSEDEWFIGEDKTFTYNIVTGKKIEVRATVDEGDTSVIVAPLAEAITSGDLIRFGNIILTTDQNRQAGDTTLNVSATTGKIPLGSIGYVIQDITGWNFEWDLLTSPGAATSTLSKTPSISNATNGVAVCTVADTDTDALAPGNYYYRMRRTDAGSETVLAYGKAVLRRA